MAVKRGRLRRRRRRRGRRGRHDEQQGGMGPLVGLEGMQQSYGNRAVQQMVMQREEGGMMPDAILNQSEDYEPEDTLESNKYPSGYHWIDKYPLNTSLELLDSDYKGSVDAFIDLLEAAGAEVDVVSTTIPMERTYLMHWAWRIAVEGFDPRMVPDMHGVDIRWWHGDLETSEEAAWSMVKEFEIDHLEEAPLLRSPYTDGLVVATEIHWDGDLVLKRGQPDEVVVMDGDRDATNPYLMAFAEQMDMIHLLTIPNTTEVHWAADVFGEDDV